MILVAVRALSPVVKVTGLRATREGLGISRTELALMSGIPLDALWEIEAGARRRASRTGRTDACTRCGV